MKHTQYKKDSRDKLKVIKKEIEQEYAKREQAHIEELDLLRKRLATMNEDKIAAVKEVEEQYSQQLEELQNELLKMKEEANQPKGSASTDEAVQTAIKQMQERYDPKIKMLEQEINEKNAKLEQLQNNNSDMRAHLEQLSAFELKPLAGQYKTPKNSPRTIAAKKPSNSVFGRIWKALNKKTSTPHKRRSRKVPK